VRVVGDTELIGQVDVQVAFCHAGPTANRRNPHNKGDVYQKKIGREIAAKQPIKAVPLRYLPQELGRIQRAVMARSYGRCAPQPGTDYSFAMKYFLPKE
jgi:hypothetical protein